MAIDKANILIGRLGKVPKTPDFIQMVDDIETVEITPRSLFWQDVTTLRANDWLMGSEYLKKLLGIF